MSSVGSQKPFILFAVPFTEGHLSPALQISEYLVKRGFDVTITGIEPSRAKIEAIGAHLAPMLGPLGAPHKFFSLFPEFRESTTPYNSNKILEAVLIDMLPTTLETIRFALSAINKRDPARKIVILSDVIFSGTLGFKLLSDEGVPPGFEGPVPKTMGISVMPSMWTSIDSGPMGAALGFDQSDAGRARNKLVANYFYRNELTSTPMHERMKTVLRQLGIEKNLDELYGDHANRIHHWVGDASFVCHDVTLQMCIPSLEYPFSDLPAHVKFGGTLPKRPLPADLMYPDWFSEIRGNSTKPAAEKKKIVMVAQGTVAVNLDLLVVPTIKALAGKDDLLLIAILCVRGATLDEKLSQFPNSKIPSNVRVVDYFPYDAILEHADLFVSQSGYGGLQHAVSNGVPLVQTGTGEDKPEVGLRIEWAGIGVYIHASPPTPEQVSKAVDKVLAGGFKNRTKELQTEAAQFDTLAKVEEEILVLAK